MNSLYLPFYEEILLIAVNGVPMSISLFFIYIRDYNMDGGQGQKFENLEKIFHDEIFLTWTNEL
jgi:hypothetical protein